MQELHLKGTYGIIKNHKGDLLMPTHTLDGKRIIFIGNSYINWGNVTHTVHPTVCEQSKREGDMGYFYQICLANGENVSVCNWTFGSHGLHHLPGDPCAAKVGCDGVDHLSFLLDRHFDYVVFCPGGGPFIQYICFLIEVFCKREYL